jgi:hypothetical protein
VTRGGTAAYEGVPDIPELVLRAVEVARESGFELSYLLGERVHRALHS